MPAISTFHKEEKQWLWLNLHEKVGISLKRVLDRTLFSGTEHDYSDADAVQSLGDNLFLMLFQSIKQTMNLSISPSIGQSINQSINQSIKQSIH